MSGYKGMSSYRPTWSRGGRVFSGKNPVSSKKKSKRNAIYDNSWEVKASAAEESMQSDWGALNVIDLDSDENQKVIKWDDSGGLDALKRAQENQANPKREFQVIDAFAEYDRCVREMQSAIDWDSRRACDMPLCADELPLPEKKGGRFSRKDLLRCPSPVILNLPGLEDDVVINKTSHELPPDYVPIPTGWGDCDEEDQGISPLSAPPLSDTVRCTGMLELGHYEDILPSGWGDVDTDNPVKSPPRWEALQAEGRVVCSGWGT